MLKERLSNRLSRRWKTNWTEVRPFLVLGAITGLIWATFTLGADAFTF